MTYAATDISANAHMSIEVKGVLLFAHARGQLTRPCALCVLPPPQWYLPTPPALGHRRPEPWSHNPAL